MARGAAVSLLSRASRAASHGISVHNGLLLPLECGRIDDEKRASRIFLAGIASQAACSARGDRRTARA